MLAKRSIAARVYKCPVARDRRACGRASPKKCRPDCGQSRVCRSPCEGSAARLRKRPNKLDRVGRAFIWGKRRAQHSGDAQRSRHPGRFDRHFRSGDQKLRSRQCPSAREFLSLEQGRTTRAARRAFSWIVEKRRPQEQRRTWAHFSDYFSFDSKTGLERYPGREYSMPSALKLCRESARHWRAGRFHRSPLLHISAA